MLWKPVQVLKYVSYAVTASATNGYISRLFQNGNSLYCYTGFKRFRRAQLTMAVTTTTEGENYLKKKSQDVDGKTLCLRDIIRNMSYLRGIPVEPNN